jgi:hypothetical protein
MALNSPNEPQMDDVTKALEIANVDCHELVTLLWNHFNCPLQISKSEIIFSKPEAPSFLKILFTKHHLLKAILRSSKLSDTELEQIIGKIRTELLDKSQISVGREILFSWFPVNGFFKFKDELQILPVPSSAPQSVGWGGGHPFVLEFRFVTSPNFFISSFRRSQIATRNSTILTLFLEGGITQRQSKARGHWVFVPNATSGKPECKYLSEGYHYDGFKIGDDSFSNTDGFSPIVSVPENEYFTRWGLLAGKPMEIPDSLSDLISKFWHLPLLKREQFYRAAYWFKQAQNSYFESKSFSYLAAVMAIETLVEDEKDATKCPTCSKTQGKGPTKKFREFLDKFALFTSDSNEEQRVKTELYEMRSKLAHGGKIFIEDIDSHSVTMTSTQSAEEQNKTELIFRVTRIALINWLSSQTS